MILELAIAVSSIIPFGSTPVTTVSVDAARPERVSIRIKWEDKSIPVRDEEWLEQLAIALKDVEIP